MKQDQKKLMNYLAIKIAVIEEEEANVEKKEEIVLNTIRDDFKLVTDRLSDNDDGRTLENIMACIKDKYIKIGSYKVSVDKLVEDILMDCSMPLYNRISLTLSPATTKTRRKAHQKRP